MSDRDQWLTERRTGIGGSDAAAVFGLSPHRTALELYHDKRGDLRPDDSEESAWLRWGRLLEPVVRQAYSDQMGVVVQQVPGIVRHPDHEWMLASLDGHVGDGVIYEGKTARTSDGWGEPGTDQVPEHILFQCHHYLCVTGRLQAHVAVLIGGSDFRIYKIDADDEFQSMLIEGEREFWSRVVSGDPPPPDFSRSSGRALLRKLYPGTDGQIVPAGEDLQKWRDVYEDSSRLASLYQGAADAAKAHLLYHMGNAARLDFEDGRCLRRKLIKKKGYVVEPSEYIDARFATIKE